MSAFWDLFPGFHLLQRSKLFLYGLLPLLRMLPAHGLPVCSRLLWPATAIGCATLFFGHSMSHRYLFIESDPSATAACLLGLIDKVMLSSVIYASTVIGVIVRSIVFIY